MPEHKRVLVISVDAAEAAFRLRMSILPTILPEMSFAFVRRPADAAGRRKLLATAGDYDAVVVQRKLLDPGHARLLRRRAKKIIFDLDDNVMTQRREISRWSQWLKDRRFKATAAAVDHVVAGNDFVAEPFRARGCDVTVLPTVVDPGHYNVKTHHETDEPVLVWIGSRSTLPYLQAAMPALEEAAQQVPGLRLVVSAQGPPVSDVLPIDFVPWSVDTESFTLLKGDIGIAPTPDDEWSRGKSGFKIIQYMATGLPTIASPVGANSKIVTDQTGLLATTDAEWTAAVVKLATDAAARKQMGAAARAEAERSYSLERARSVWAKILA